MLSSAQLTLETAKIHLRRTRFDDKNSVAVARDIITAKITNTLREENIDFDVLDRLNSLYTALNVVYDSFK